MAHQVKWSRRVLDVFIEEAMLNPFEIDIMETRVNENLTITEQSIRFACSKSKIEKAIALLKKKYDNVQKLRPDELPPRKFSAKEVYMDTN